MSQPSNKDVIDILYRNEALLKDAAKETMLLRRRLEAGGTASSLPKGKNINPEIAALAEVRHMRKSEDRRRRA